MSRFKCAVAGRRIAADYRISTVRPRGLKFPPPMTRSAGTVPGTREHCGTVAVQIRSCRTANYCRLPDFGSPAARFQFPPPMTRSARAGHREHCGGCRGSKSAITGRQIATDYRISTVRPRHQFPKFIAANSQLMLR
jgi:hypothetical protein